jgi:hypothetical protein
MTGQWPTPQAYWQSVQAGQAAYPRYGGAWTYPPPFVPGSQPGVAPEAMAEQELAWLKNQADMLNQQLEQINTRISELEQASE